MKDFRVVVVHLNRKKEARMRTKRRFRILNKLQWLLQTATNSSKITGNRPELDPVSDGDLNIESNTATEPSLEDMKALWNLHHRSKKQ